MMPNSLFEWMIIVCATVAGGVFFFVVLDTLQHRKSEDETGLTGRIPSIRELSRMLKLTPNLTFLAVLGTGFAGFMVLQLLQGPVFALVAVLITLVAFLLSAPLLVRLNRSLYLNAFESQLPIVIDQIIAQLRSSRTLAQGITAVPEFLPEPSAGEMFEIADRAQRGLGLDQALIAAGRKYKLRNFTLLIAVFRMFVRQGGNVIEPLQRMSVAYKELIKADAYVRTASTQGRTIFFIINGAIFMMFSFVSLAQPQLITQIFVNVVSILIFAVGVLIYLAGSVWMWVMMRVDV